MKVIFVLLCLMTSSLLAHHGPQHQVKALSARIDQSPSSSLLTLRASLYIEAGNIEKAKKDLYRALKLNPDYKPAQKLTSSIK